MLVFAQGCGWDRTWQILLQYKGHALLLDTGAASNLCGAYTIKDYEEECLLPYGYHITTS